MHIVGYVLLLLSVGRPSGFCFSLSLFIFHIFLLHLMIKFISYCLAFLMCQVAFVSLFTFALSHWI
jgi:hypothetical protein